MKYLSIIIICAVLSCNSKDTTNNVSTNDCVLTNIENELTTMLSNYTTSVDFSFFIEREDGKSFAYNRGSSTLNTSYKSASTSKWVSAAIILWSVENVAGFDLTDTPIEHYAWSMGAGDPLYGATLSQLLSFTSGMENSPTCLTVGIPAKNFNNCINDVSGSVVSVNEGNAYTPGVDFYYGSQHLQVAGAMAIDASSESNWSDLFDSFKTDSGLFANSSYNLPSVSNPRLAGGMTWTGNDYVSFLRAVYTKSFMADSLFDSMFTDHIQSKSISYSPVLNDYNEQWHYGYGVWLECHNNTFNCSSIDYHSSPGAYGAYPFVSFNHKYFGIVAREGALGTFTEGIDLFRNIQSKAESWASCKN
jgi:hypothetical protein